jgi:hypothetical protein
MVRMNRHLLVADEVWLAAATLQKSRGSDAAFSASEILNEVRRGNAHPQFRPGITAHIHLHCVANLPPNTATYRMLYRQPDGRLRLFRNSDASHPDRRGKAHPNRHELPEEYHPLLDWYEHEYAGIRADASPENDPLLRLAGSGRGLWSDVDIDEYVRDLRSDEESPAHAVDRFETVWRNIKIHQGEAFRTATGLKVSYRLKGDAGLWFYRDGKRINRFCVASQIRKAVERMPLRKTTDLKDLIDYPYLFALLTDHHIAPKELR